MAKQYGHTRSTQTETQITNRTALIAITSTDVKNAKEATAFLAMLIDLIVRGLNLPIQYKISSFTFEYVADFFLSSNRFYENSIFFFCFGQIYWALEQKHRTMKKEQRNIDLDCSMMNYLWDKWRVLNRDGYSIDWIELNRIELNSMYQSHIKMFQCIHQKAKTICCTMTQVFCTKRKITEKKIDFISSISLVSLQYGNQNMRMYVFDFGISLHELFHWNNKKTAHPRPQKCLSLPFDGCANCRSETAK